MRKNFGSKPWLYPQPVLIITTYSDDGTPNAMNAAWGGVYEADQIVLCLDEGHKTTQNIKKRGAFAVSMADAAHVIPCDYVGLVSGNKVPEKLEKAGFHVTKSEFVDAPVIDELPLALECQLVKVTEDGQIIGRIVNVSADQAVLDGDGNVDSAKLNIIIFDTIGNTYRSIGGAVGKAFSDGAVLK